MGAINPLTSFKYFSVRVIFISCLVVVSMVTGLPSESQCGSLGDDECQCTRDPHCRYSEVSNGNNGAKCVEVERVCRDLEANFLDTECRHIGGLYAYRGSICANQWGGGGICYRKVGMVHGKYYITTPVQGRVDIRLLRNVPAPCRAFAWTNQGPGNFEIVLQTMALWKEGLANGSSLNVMLNNVNVLRELDLYSLTEGNGDSLTLRIPFRVRWSETNDSMGRAKTKTVLLLKGHPGQELTPGAKFVLKVCPGKCGGIPGGNEIFRFLPGIQVIRYITEMDWTNENGEEADIKSDLGVRSRWKRDFLGAILGALGGGKPPTEKPKKDEKSGDDGKDEAEGKEGADDDDDDDDDDGDDEKSGSGSESPEKGGKKSKKKSKAKKKKNTSSSDSDSDSDSSSSSSSSEDDVNEKVMNDKKLKKGNKEKSKNEAKLKKSQKKSKKGEKGAPDMDKPPKATTPKPMF